MDAEPSHPPGEDNPLVDLTKGVQTPPEPDLAAPLTSFQKRMRSRLGLVVFLLISFGMGFFPLIVISLALYIFMWIGEPHWPLRRFIDLCVAHWMSIITVSVILVCLFLHGCGSRQSMVSSHRVWPTRALF